MMAVEARTFAGVLAALNSDFVAEWGVTLISAGFNRRIRGDVALRPRARTAKPQKGRCRLEPMLVLRRRDGTCASGPHAHTRAVRAP
jgi:hypothetical protein